MAADENPKHQMTVRSATSEETPELVTRQRAERRASWGCMTILALSVETFAGMVSLLFGVSSFASFVVEGLLWLSHTWRSCFR